MGFPANTKILIVDDSITVRTVVKKTLIALGFSEISQGTNGEEGYQLALSAVQSGAGFGLIISDYNMPVLKGIDFLRKVRSNPQMAKLPFVLLTAENEKELIMEALSAGLTEFLLKPFTQETLAAKLQSAYQKTA